MNRNPVCLLTILCSLTFGLSALSPLTVCAQTPAYSFNTGTHDPYYDNYVGGFEFTTTTRFNVTELGYYDYQQDGLATSHAVGIYNDGGTLLASLTVDAGTANTLLGKFRYKPLGNPLTLSANSTYTIAAVNNTSDASVIYDASDPVNSTGLMVNADLNVPTLGALYTYNNPSVLSDPTSNYGYQVYAGPNFILGPDSTPATPEPGTNALLFNIGLASSSLLIRRRRLSLRMATP